VIWIFASPVIAVAIAMICRALVRVSRARRRRQRWMNLAANIRESRLEPHWRRPPANGHLDARALRREWSRYGDRH
jgi:hypothetical protein